MVRLSPREVKNDIISVLKPVTHARHESRIENEKPYLVLPPGGVH
jgi:hypothetical protein